MVAQASDWGKIWIAVMVVTGASGCASLQGASSGQIGCAEDDITITNDSVGWSSRTWTAECHGKRFFCSAVPTGKDQSQVNCKEEISNADAAPAGASKPKPPAAGGCQFDTQCKGDRVCVEGHCVE